MTRPPAITRQATTVHRGATLRWVAAITARTGRARLVFGATAALILVESAIFWAWSLATFDDSSRFASDYQILMNAATRWLSGGPFYPPEQVAAPFDAFKAGIMYPPIAIPFLATFSRLPAVLWWAIPLALAAWGIGRLKPAPWTWPIIALAAMYDNSVWLILSGNPLIWGMASLAWLERGWTPLFFVLKPSLGPLALLGVRRRSWWIGAAVLALVGLAFLPMWSDWLAVMRHAQSGRGLLYSAFDLPLLAIPLVARLGRSRPAR